MNILLILLECNISYLLSNRINNAVNFVGNLMRQMLTGLSGKIKNPNEDTITEAEKMAEQISKFEKIHTDESRRNK